MLKTHQQYHNNNDNNIEIQMDHLISARRPDLVRVNKKQKERTNWIVNFAVQANHRVKLKESNKRDKYWDLARELKKLRKVKVTVIPIVTGALGTVTKGLVKGLKIRGGVETIQKYCIVKIGQNTEKSPDDSRRLAGTRNLVKNQSMFGLRCWLILFKSFAV